MKKEIVGVIAEGDGKRVKPIWYILYGMFFKVRGIFVLMTLESTLIKHMPLSLVDGIFGDGPVGQVCEDVASLLSSGDVSLFDERDLIVRTTLTYYNSLEVRGEKVSAFIRADLGYQALQAANSLQKYLDAVRGFPTQAVDAGVNFNDHYAFVTDAMLDLLSNRSCDWVSTDAQYLIFRTPERVLDSMLVAMQRRFDDDCGWKFNDIHELLVKPLQRYESGGSLVSLRSVIQTVISYSE